MSSNWVAHWDDGSQAYYYENTTTGETSWEQPADYVPPEQEEHQETGATEDDALSSSVHSTAQAAVEWRMHPEKDTACALSDFIAEYGDSDGNAYVPVLAQ